MNNAAILANQHVVAHLVIILGMGSNEGIDRRTQPVDSFMQYDHPWLRVNAIAEGILFMALAIVCRVNADALHPPVQLGVLISEPLAQAWVGGEAGIGQGRAPGRVGGRLGCGLWGAWRSRLAPPHVVENFH